MSASPSRNGPGLPVTDVADAVSIRRVEGADPVGEPEYALGRTVGEYDRLIEQAQIMRPLTERMLHSAGARPGMHVLDVGCGVGDVSFLVSEIVGEQGSVVGVDVDEAALKVAEGRRAATGIGNVEFRAGNIALMAFDREFDAAVGRFVLMFIDDPTAVLRRLREALRPGGIVAFQEWVGDVRGVSSARAAAALLDVGALRRDVRAIGRPPDHGPGPVCPNARRRL